MYDQVDEGDALLTEIEHNFFKGLEFFGVFEYDTAAGAGSAVVEMDADFSADVIGILLIPNGVGENVIEIGLTLFGVVEIGFHFVAGQDLNGGWNGAMATEPTVGRVLVGF